MERMILSLRREGCPPGPSPLLYFSADQTVSGWKTTVSDEFRRQSRLRKFYSHGACRMRTRRRNELREMFVRHLFVTLVLWFPFSNVNADATCSSNLKTRPDGRACSCLMLLSNATVHTQMCVNSSILYTDKIEMLKSVMWQACECQTCMCTCSATTAVTARVQVCVRDSVCDRGSALLRPGSGDHSTGQVQEERERNDHGVSSESRASETRRMLCTDYVSDGQVSWLGRVLPALLKPTTRGR